jgi:geranylgeranyl diphosphate synthase type II
LGFQLKDDLLDTYGDETVFGKKTGIDILTNKKTFLYLKALEAASAAEKSELLKLYNSGTDEPQQKVNSVVDFFSRFKVFNATELEIDKYFKAAMYCLDQIDVDETKKDYFREVAHRMIDRDK